MKKIKILLLILCVMLSFAVHSQSKVAHVNTNEIIMLMPATKAADLEIEQLQKTYQEELQEIAQEFEKTRNRYLAEKDSQTDEENTRRDQELQTQMQSIQNFQAEIQKELQKKSQELIFPIEQEVMDVINKIARAQGLEYVFTNPMQGLLVAKGKDITEDVKKELGI